VDASGGGGLRVVVDLASKKFVRFHQILLMPSESRELHAASLEYMCSCSKLSVDSRLIRITVNSR